MNAKENYIPWRFVLPRRITSRGTLWMSLLFLGCGSRSDLTEFGSLSDSRLAADNGASGGRNATDALSAQPGQRGSSTPASGDLGGSSPTGSIGGDNRQPEATTGSTGSPSTSEGAGLEGNSTSTFGDSEDESDVGPPTTPCRAEEQGVGAVLAGIVRAVESERPEDRASIRYLVAPTLRTNHCRGVPAVEGNYSDFTRDGLREQFAATKVVNSTSTSPSIARVTGVPGLPWLLRIDLRELNWNEPIAVDAQSYSDAWEASSALTAQSLQFTGGAAEALSQQMQTNTPFQLIGDFLSTIGRGEMYYALTHAPSTLQQLKEQLGILPTETLDTSAWLRAGFSTSGISKQYRSVARYVGEQAATGLVFWQTHDFEPDSAFAGVYEDPLGSGSDQKQVVYNLPNDMQGYFIANSQGDRVLTVPPSVDINPAENGGILSVGVSCTACHNGGLVPFQDQVREYVGQRLDTRFDAETVQRVEEIYPPRRELNRIVEQDSLRFLEALEATGIPRNSPDSVSRVYLQNELGDVRRAEVAAELFVAPETLSEKVDVLPAILRVATDTRTLDRNQFARVYRQAMCVLQTGEAIGIAGCP